MRKICIDGEEWITFDEVAYAVHETRKKIKAGAISLLDSIDCFVQELCEDELVQAKDEDEREKIIEMPGDYIICRNAWTRKKGEIECFNEFYCGCQCCGDNENSCISLNMECAEKFDYESDAKEVLKDLGESWYIVDMGKTATHKVNKMKKLLKAIFDGDEIDKDADEEIEVIIHKKNNDDEELTEQDAEKGEDENDFEG